MKTLIICIDGLPYDLFNEENMPFLYNYAKNNYFTRLKTLFAFTGLEYTFFTGKTPDQTNIWLEFIKKDSIFNSKLIKLFSFNKKIRDYAAALVQLLHKRTWLSGTHNIPNKILKHLDTSTTQGIWKLDFFKDKTFAVYKWPFFATENKTKLIFKYESDEKRLKRLSKEDKDICYAQLMNIDKTIHKYGKYSEETKQALRKTDELIKKNIPENTNMIVWSDHGFIDIKENIDLQKLIPESDFFAFYAGTTAHFWFKDETTKEKITKILSEQTCGVILTDELKEKYKIPKSNDYGDLIFAINPGYYIFPNYYQTKPFKSMHGYMCEDILDGIFITNKQKIPKDLKICNILEVLE